MYSSDMMKYYEGQIAAGGAAAVESNKQGSEDWN